ncbi:hypothetical protein DICPUDRAFT_86074 [Dictyostelium purpureum]|uniref:J domain-containing protein n=1 Tax=Dictyostelium purpureum TaxID=5786 RepID=F0Z9A0_DICPU|nr:uncharacterized protein DICPUDRAFT_86074 [Dictyostelium purpureum]EGC39433.1 hypothetical protein DICPUDRAFT_86074 [Dictyostelium purpureum]|eukprot:XP_003283991.1 hypothetical protein DICPUDRAFT_86074 [Dictyostelium purpureum]
MESFTEKMFDIQRRATQAVLQKIGATEQTHDEHFDNTYTNFKRLGEFLTHLEESTQSSISQMEKMSFNNSQLASSVCNFVLSELSNDDSEFSTGLLSKFFLKTSNNPNLSPSENNKESLHRQSNFQESVQRLYDSFGTMGHENMAALQDDINHKVVRPIKRDEELNKVTKQLLEKRKKLNFDFDALKRSTDMEKVKNTKEEFDSLSKKTVSHLQNRSFVRCKLIVHSVITMIQQFCIFFESNSLLLEGLITFIEPLLSQYQLKDDQLADIYNVKKTAPNTPAQSQTPSSQSPTQQRNNMNNSNSSMNNNNNNNNNNNINGSKPLPNTPPPTYKEHVDSHPNSLNNSSGEPKSRMNGSTGVNNINDDFSKVSFNDRPSPHSESSSSGFSNNSSPSNSQQKPKEEKLFSVWEDEANGGNNNSGSKGNDDDWMYDKPTPAPTPKPEKSWDDPILVPEQSPFTSFNTNTTNTPQQPNYFNQQQQQQQPNKPQTQQQQFNMNNMAQQQQQAQQQQPQQTQTPKKPSGFENIFGDFDFTPSSQRKSTPTPPPTNQTSSPSQQQQYGQPQPPPMNYFTSQAPSPHVDRDQHERAMIEPIISEKIKQWAEKNGRKNNLRVLLATLHEVLWEGSGWEKASNGSLITPVGVKKVYRKAIMVVHPDKVHTGTNEQKMIAQRIFEYLRESFEVFKVDLEPGN